MSAPATLQEPRWARWLLIGMALAFVGVFLLLPLMAVFINAFAQGWRTYLAAITDEYAWAALKLTLLTAAIVLPLNALFGIAAAWLIARFRFPGRQLLLTLIDVPLAVSPVIAGMIFVLLYGSRGWFGGILEALDLKVIFAVPGIVLVTLFVTLPFVARELIPLMMEQGSAEEEAALTLGASPLQMFLHVTLPKIRWGLLYGVILCNARAMGEFGAASVVSGHIRGVTNTLPLHIEVLYNEYQFAASFAVASILAALALVTLILKTLLEWRFAAN